MEKNALSITNENLRKACEVFDLDFDKIIKGQSSNPFLKDKKSDDLVKAENADTGSGKELEKENNVDVLFKALGVEPDSLKVAISILPKVAEMGILFKGMEDTLSRFKLGDEKESFINKVDTLVKGYNKLTEINTELKSDLKKADNKIVSLTNKVELIERVPLREKKSITSDKIEKSFGGEENTLEGKTVYSISKNKQTINTLLGDRMQEEIAKGLSDGPFGQAAMTFEASGRLSKPVIEALNRDNIVLVQ